jgi:CheY-like chemotaxis protein
MDVEMPTMDGWEATKELVRMRDCGEIKELCRIIGHTAFGTVADIDRCYASGMNAVLPKPCSFDQIQELLETL